MFNLVSKYKKEIKYVLFALFSLLMIAQIGLGMGWMFMNWGTVPIFRDTDFYIQAAENLVLDEYVGILYPVLIRMAKIGGQFVGIPYAGIIYTMQSMAAVYATVYLLKRCKWIQGNGWKRMAEYLFLTAYIFTFPMILQLHFSVLPYSLVFSVGMIMVSDGIALRKEGDINVAVLLKISVCWVVLALLLPEYGWIGGVFVVLCWSQWLIKSGFWRKRMLLCILAGALLIAGVGQVTQKPGSMGRIRKNVESGLLLRVVWPNFVTHSFFWPEEIEEIFSIEELDTITRYREGVIYEFGPKLEAAYGEKEARNLYMQMVKTSLGLNTKQVLADVSGDFLGYLFPQAVLQIQKQNNKGSLLPWNYGQLQEKAPLLTKYYVNYSFAGWNVMCTIGLLMGIRKKKAKTQFNHIVVLGSTIFAALWYTMQGAGAQDYKQIALISLLWLMPAVKGWICLASETECEENENE